MAKKIQTIRKIGDSCYVLVPKDVRDILNVSEGDDLEIIYREVQDE